MVGLFCQYFMMLSQHKFGIRQGGMEKHLLNMRKDTAKRNCKNGSRLCLKQLTCLAGHSNPGEWNSALEGYERAPDKEIFEVLKISYDTLDDIQKEIFLDVACFFKDKYFKHVKDILLSFHGIKSKYAIEVLINRSLIKIEYSCLTMHDLIEDMGKEISQQESPNELSGRSRLWFYQDILHILQENTGTNKVEGIVLDLPEGKEVQWSGQEFMKMKNLRILIIKRARFSRPPTNLPSSLRVLDWSHYQWDFLPPDFHPTNLVCLNLNNFRREQLKSLSTKNFDSLSIMCLNDSEFLTQVPDLSGVPNLQELVLYNCPRLIEIHDSVGTLSKLRNLYAQQCTNLRTLPHGIKLTSLEYLSLKDCSSLQSFPEVLEKMEKTRKLDLSGTAIEELPYSICNLTGLQELNVTGCKHLKQLPASILMLPELQKLDAYSCRDIKLFSKGKDGEGEEVSSVVPSKQKVLNLCLMGCNLSDESISTWLPWFRGLTDLDLCHNSFTILPACIKECHLLRNLYVAYCKLLRIIEALPPNLETFDAVNCTSLTPLALDMLLDQAFHVAEKGALSRFILPGQRVPEWFHHYSDGESMCFWVRGEFPDLLLCVVFADDMDDEDREFEDEDTDDEDCGQFQLSVRISGIDGYLYTIVSEMDHIILVYVQSLFPEGELQKLLLKDQWTQVELLLFRKCEPILIKQIGVYVYEQENSKEINIRFLRPNNRTCHDLYDSNNDLELGYHPLMKKIKKRRTSLDMGVYDCESLDMQHQRGLALIPTGHETVYKDKGKSLLVNNDGSEGLSMGSCGQQPSLHDMNWDSNSMDPLPTSTSDS